MSFRTDFLPTYDAIQELAGPSGYDVRPNRIYAVTRTWSGGQVGLGDGVAADYVDTRTEILPRPRVKETEMGRRLKVEPVSQQIAASVLNPLETASTERLFEIEGPNAGPYKLIDYSDARPFRQVLLLERLERRQPTPIG